METSTLEIKALSSSNYLILDVRTPEEFNEARVFSAINLPLDKIDEDSAKAALAEALSQNKKIFTICKSGYRSLKACEKLKELGYESLSIAGGTLAAIKDGLDISYGPAKS